MKSTTTPLQALVLLNDPQFVEAARVLAEQLVRQYPADPPARHRLAFRRLIGRAPDARELAILDATYLEQRGTFLADSAGADGLLGVGQAPRDAALPPADVAATAMVANLIMNLDAFVVIR